MIALNPKLHLQGYLVHPGHWIDANLAGDDGVVDLQRARALSVRVSFDLVAAVPADERRVRSIFELHYVS